MDDDHIAAAFSDGTADDLPVRTQNAAPQTECADHRNQFVDLIHFFVRDSVALGSLRSLVCLQKRHQFRLPLGNVCLERPVGVHLFELIDMVALPGILSARVGAEISRFIQIISPAADVCDGNIGIPQGEPRNGGRPDVGKVQADLAVTAIPFDLGDGAAFRSFVARTRERIMEPYFARKKLLKNQAIFFDRVFRRKMFVPHKLETERKI